MKSILTITVLETLVASTGAGAACWPSTATSDCLHGYLPF